MNEEMVHVWMSYVSKNMGDNNRMCVAQMTWEMQDWAEFPLVNEDFERMFTDRGGSVPFIKDIFDKACDWNPDSTIVFTNSDICVHSQCSKRIRSAMRNASACYSRRRDFFQDFNGPIPDDLIASGASQVGIDLFAFRPVWWKLIRDEYPDMLLGRMGWDGILVQIVEDTNPGASSSLHNISYHRDHPSTWSRVENIRSLPSQMHCIANGRGWCESVGFNPSHIGL
jgi:hypothetical protein